jgi:exoribonuclease-2
MERYWCLRWLAQESVTVATAQVLKENIVRFDAIPLVLKANGLPTLERGTHVRLSIAAIDLLAAEAKVGFIELLPVEGVDAALPEAGTESTGE